MSAQLVPEATSLWYLRARITSRNENGSRSRSKASNSASMSAVMPSSRDCSTSDCRDTEPSTEPSSPSPRRKPFSLTGVTPAARAASTRRSNSSAVMRFSSDRPKTRCVRLRAVAPRSAPPWRAISFAASRRGKAASAPRIP